MLIEVPALDLATMYAKAERLAVPDGGVLTVMVPPVRGRLSEALRPALAAIGATPLIRPASGEAQETENSLMRLKAHGITTLILLNAHWMRPDTRNMLATAVALTGITTFVITHPQDQTESPVQTWRDLVLPWAEFIRWADGQQATWAAAAQLAEHHQLTPMPRLGLHDPLALRAPTPHPSERSAFVAMQATLKHDSPPSAVHAALRRMLATDHPTPRIAILRGSASALSEAGYQILAERPVLQGGAPSSPLLWRDLRRVADTSVAAAVTLMALGCDERGCARLTTDGVSSDGSRIYNRGRWNEIAPAARPYLVAQRLLRPSGDVPFLVRGSNPVAPSTVRTMVSEGLAQLGIALDPTDMNRGLRPSQRWLLELGIIVRGSERPRPDERTAFRSPGDRRCQHGLPNWIDLEPGEVSHSQRLCRAVALEDARPAQAGYRVRHVDASIGIQRYAVALEGVAAGALWKVETPRSPVWVQSLRTEVPALDVVRRCVLASQAADVEALGSRTLRVRALSSDRLATPRSATPDLRRCRSSIQETWARVGHR